MCIKGLFEEVYKSLIYYLKMCIKAKHCLKAATSVLSFLETISTISFNLQSRKLYQIKL